MDFTHFDEKGNAIMVDVSSKDTTQRTAIAYGEICVGQEILEKIENHQMKKGDVLSVARTLRPGCGWPRRWTAANNIRCCNSIPFFFCFC